MKIHLLKIHCQIVDSVVTATTVTVQDSTDLISYEITNAKLLNVIPDLDAVSLLIYIETTDEVQLH